MKTFQPLKLNKETLRTMSVKSDLKTGALKLGAQHVPSDPKYGSCDGVCSDGFR